MVRVAYKYIILAMVVLCVSGLILGMQGLTCYAEEVPNVVDLTTSNVYDDLKTSTINGAPFDVAKYPFGDNLQTQVISFVEYCYGFDSLNNYGLYVYVYNPKDLDFNLFSASNQIEIGVGKTAVDYNKYNLIYCNKSTGALDNLFLKFKVSNALKISELVNREKREYNVSGLELFVKGDISAVDCPVGWTYAYSGYAKGLGDKNAVSPLKISVSKLDTIELSVKSTFYRTGISDLGKNHQNQVDSVYFSVPNSILETYGYLQRIKAVWYEYRTQPIFVTENADVYTDLFPYLGKKIDYPAIPYIFTQHANRLIGDLTYLFSSVPQDLEKYVLNSEKLKEWIYGYDKSFNSGTLALKDHNISKDLFVSEFIAPGVSSVGNNRTYGYNCKEVDLEKDKFTLPAYSEANNWFDSFLDYGFFPPLLDDTYPSMSPFAIISSKMLREEGAPKKYLVDAGDINAVASYCDAAAAKNETTFLFRFANTDYHTFPFEISKGLKSAGSAYLASENVFLDFDIIQLTFNKNGVLVVMPVVSSPIDVVADVTPPLEAPKFKFPDWLKWVGLALILIITLVVFMPILPYIIKFVFYVISLPFRFIAWCISGLKRGVSSSKPNTKNLKQGKPKYIDRGRGS